MAKAAFTQLVEGTFVIEHNAMKHDFSMADYLNNLTEEILLDEDLLVTWASEHEILKGLIHSGLKHDIIQQRAIVRKNKKDGEPISITPELHDEYQAAILAHRPKEITKPGTRTVNVDTVVGALTAEQKAELIKKLQEELAG